MGPSASSVSLSMLVSRAFGMLVLVGTILWGWFGTVISVHLEENTIISERVTNTSVTLLGLLLSDTLGILEVLKEETETSLAGLMCYFKALTPCVRGCGFVIQCTHILPQHICDLGNSQSCGCALGNAVYRRQGRLLCWVNTAPWAAAVLSVVYLVTKQSSALFLPWWAEGSGKGTAGCWVWCSKAMPPWGAGVCTVCPLQRVCSEPPCLFCLPLLPHTLSHPGCSSAGMGSVQCLCEAALSHTALTCERC